MSAGSSNGPMAVAVPDEGAALLVSPVRRAIVDAVANHAPEPEEPGGLTAAQLAEMLDLHVTTVRFHLDQLVAHGLLEAHFVKGGVGRPSKHYGLAAGSLQQGSTEAGQKALMALLAESFGADLTPAEAGADWTRRHIPADGSRPAQTAGAWLTKVGRMIDVLQDWGYTPDLSTSEGGRTCRIDLVRCPFLDLARSNPAVVCGIHRGLIAGAMERFGETDAEVSLEPFVGPELCQAHLRTRTPFRLPSASPAAHTSEESS